MLRSENKSKIFFTILVMCYLFISVALGFIPDKYRTYELALICGQMVIFIPSAIYIAIDKNGIVKDIPFNRISFSNILIIIAITILMIPVLTFINAFSMLFVDNVVTEALNGVKDNGIAANLIMIALMPAAFEELTFRGIIYHGIRRQGKLNGLIISALCFGMFHMNLNQFAYAIVIGAVMVMLVEATGSIFASMIMHFIVNANSVCLMYARINTDTNEAVSQATGGMTVSMVISLGVVAAIAVGFIAVLFHWLCRRCGTLEHVRSIFTVNKSDKKKKTIDTQSIVAGAVMIAGMAVCVLIMI